jgi:glycosyltransferase involved in cell wall biosynthesis
LIRIGFDRQTFTIQRYGGISRYFSDLYLGLCQTPAVEAELLFKWHQNAYLAEQGIGINLHPIAAKYYIKGLTKGNFELPLAKLHDIHHSTYYLGRPKKCTNNIRLVSTLYDMIPELLPGFFKGNPHANKLGWFNASDLIISISDSAAADLAYFQPHLADRIRRIHLYSGFGKESPQRKPASLAQSDNPHLLFVGSRGGYKNAAMLLRAFAASEPGRHGNHLLFGGGGAFSKEELAAIVRLGIAQYVQQVSVNDAELWYLYLNAAAVIVPSMAEGFSLPLVEGLTADVPIVCSDIPVHQEVASSYATLVNPMQHQKWTDILSSMSNLRRPSEILGQLSYRDQCNYFSKERMVQEHIMAYKGVLG